MRVLKNKSGDPSVKDLLKRLSRKPSADMNAKEYEAMLDKQVADGSLTKEEKKKLVDNFKVSSDIDKAYTDVFNLLNKK